MPTIPVQSMGTRLALIESLPQHVPSRACAACEVCCRFPEAESFLRPYFAEEEVRAALKAGLPTEAFPDTDGGQIRLVPNPVGDGYLCPAFDPAGNGCRIYESRPFDCQLYPLALMWDRAHQQVVLGWDTKCPFLLNAPARGDAGPTLEAYAEEITASLEREPRLSFLERNPRLVTPFQEDVVILHPLHEVTARVRKDCRSDSVVPLTLGDRGRFETMAAQTLPEGRDCPSAWAFANHYLWTDLLHHEWRLIGDRLCLFATTPDGTFMPVPPLGGPPTADLLTIVFAYMRRRSHAEGAVRIDNVPRPWGDAFARLGYRVVEKDPEYLYRTEALVELKGDRLKSQRGACNRLVREHAVTVEGYDGRQLDDCRALFHEWREQKRAEGPQEWASLLLEDSAAFHQRLLQEAGALGLSGWVARVDGRVRAYTFGAPIHPEVFCVLAEITDRRIVGLAEYLFRHTARHAGGAGHVLINTMDATGLPQLAKSKQAYDPICLVRPYTVSEA